MIRYVSQLGPGARYAEGDCGAACLAMLTDASTPDELMWMAGAPKNASGLSILTLQNVARRLVLPLNYRSHLSAATLRPLLADGPALCLVRYEALPLRWMQGFRGGHYVLVLEVTGDSVLYHDPLWPDGRGANRYAKIDQFDVAWRAIPGGSFRTPGQALVHGPAERNNLQAVPGIDKERDGLVAVAAEVQPIKSG